MESERGNRRACGSSPDIIARPRDLSTRRSRSGPSPRVRRHEHGGDSESAVAHLANATHRLRVQPSWSIPSLLRNIRKTARSGGEPGSQGLRGLTPSACFRTHVQVISRGRPPPNAVRVLVRDRLREPGSRRYLRLFFGRCRSPARPGPSGPGASEPRSPDHTRREESR
jgi:hypothetical protein